MDWEKEEEGGRERERGREKQRKRKRETERVRRERKREKTKMMNNYIQNNIRGKIALDKVWKRLKRNHDPHMGKNESCNRRHAPFLHREASCWRWCSVSPAVQHSDLCSTEAELTTHLSF